MGKKSKTGSNKPNKPNKVNKVTKKSQIDPSLYPDPVTPLEEEIGSLRLMSSPRTPGSLRKAIGTDGYDDGGVADLKMTIDLDDHVVRRKRGEEYYVLGVQNDSLPRMREGRFSNVFRRDQKVHLAQILFAEDSPPTGTTSGGAEADMIQNPSKASEVYVERLEPLDEETKKIRLESLRSAKFALKLSIVLKEPACICLSLTEVGRRYLTCYGNEGAEDACRCINKAVEVATSQFYDVDEMGFEAEEKPVLENHAKYASYPGLCNEELRKFMPARVATVCLRSAYLHGGNALMAMGKAADAREMYSLALPILEQEPRSARLDWERSSFLVNIGNTYSNEGNYEKANEMYTQAEKLGEEQFQVDATVDAKGIILVSMRARAFALKRNGKEQEGKDVMREVIKKQIELDADLVAWAKELNEAQEREKGQDAGQETIEAAAVETQESGISTQG